MSSTRIGEKNMANVDWYVEGIEFGNCNCVYGCPCQFEDVPTENAARRDRGAYRA
jgi:hypothetical protein